MIKDQPRKNKMEKNTDKKKPQILGQRNPGPYTNMDPKLPKR